MKATCKHYTKPPGICTLEYTVRPVDCKGWDESCLFKERSHMKPEKKDPTGKDNCTVQYAMGFNECYDQLEAWVVEELESIPKFNDVSTKYIDALIRENQR